MEEQWQILVENLFIFPGSSLDLKSASPWDDVNGAFSMLTVVSGDVFDFCKLEVCVVVGPQVTSVALVDSMEAPEGIADAIGEMCAAESFGSGPLSIRTAILRLCDALCVELDAEQSSAMKALHQSSKSCNGGSVADVQHRGYTAQQPPNAPPVLNRDLSQATSACKSDFSFESDESINADNNAGPPQSSASRTNAMSVVDHGPSVEDVVLWTAIVDGLKRFPSSAIEFKAAGSWNGVEGLIELSLHAPAGFDWEHLSVMLIVDSMQTRIELKGAQAIPTIVVHQVSELNVSDVIGQGPKSVCPAICALVEALAIELDECHLKVLEALGNRTKTAALSWTGMESLRNCDQSEVEREMMAVKALEVQLGFITTQIEHLKTRSQFSHCIEQELQHELKVLLRAQAEVNAEKEAAAAAVQAVLSELTSTVGRSSIKVSVSIDTSLPSQSLRGHGNNGANQVQTALANCGPWAHYAAHQFSAMIAREQELHDDFVCFYHSYSFVALLYEVHAVVARSVYGLPADFAPVPRLSMASSAMCADLSTLRAKGGQDHDPSFRALGLSSSCSVFASGSEAPPLSCFQAGYSCTDLSFRNLLLDFLRLCAGCGKDRDIEGMADAIVRVGGDHGLNTSCFAKGGGANQAGRNQGTLSGYMLQIFIHRSVVEKYAYPSQAMGTPIKGSVTDYIFKGSRADGQARILFDPHEFLNPEKARLFHYCARPLQSCMDASVASSRGALIADLHEALRPLLDRHSSTAIASRLMPPKLK